MIDTLGISRKARPALAPMIDIIDESFVVAAPARVAARLRDPRLWREWWPELTLTVTRDRGAEGVRWSVAGAVDGTAEFWVEPWGDGAMVRWFVRGRLRGPGFGPGEPSRRELRRAARLQRVYVAAYKHRIHRLKDEFEHDRAPGEPRPVLGG